MPEFRIIFLDTMKEVSGTLIDVDKKPFSIIHLPTVMPLVKFRMVPGTYIGASDQRGQVPRIPLGASRHTKIFSIYRTI